MKSYVSDKQFRLVGKAWEVRHQLQQMLQQAGPAVTVADYLGGLYMSQKHSVQGNKPRTSGALIIPFPIANT